MVWGMGYNCSNNFVVIFQKYSEIQIYKLSYNSALTSLNSIPYSVKCLQQNVEISFPDVVHFISTKKLYDLDTIYEW